MKTAAIVLLLIGLGLTATTSLAYFTNKEAIDKRNAKTTLVSPTYITWSPLFGLSIVGVSALAIWYTSRKTD